MTWHLPCLAALVLVAGCAQRLPDASPPPAPEAPPGWTSIGTFGGQSGAGMVGTAFDLDLSGGDVALSAACTGGETLAVFVGLETLSASAGQVPAAVFRCSDAGDAGRVELAQPPVEGASFTAVLIDSPGALRREAFMVSIEVRGD